MTSMASIGGQSIERDAPPAPLVDLGGVQRDYRLGDVRVEALRSVDLEVPQGEFLAIIGPSGSGKTTLMNIIGCLDRPTAGTYHLAGVSVGRFDDDALSRVRSRLIGFVFQIYNLLPRTSALENVAMPLLYQGVGRKDRFVRAREALEAVGLADRLNHQPSELSGGQQQRVAIARALVTRPTLILADEPTGNLDSASGTEVMLRLADLNRSGHTIIVVTHDPEVAARAHRRVQVRDGVVWS